MPGDTRPIWPRSGYFDGWRALRGLESGDEADAALREAIDRFPDEPQSAVSRAWLAHQRRNWQEAVRRWRELPDELTRDESIYRAWSGALREMKQFPEADALLRVAVERFPDNIHLAIDRAWTAHDRHDWTEALARWSQMRERFPNHSGGYFGAAASLHQMLRYAECDTMLEEAMRRFPQDLNLVLEYARFATYRQEWEEAARRWQSVRCVIPDKPEAYVRGVRALVSLRRYEEAEQLAICGIEKLPGSSDLAFEQVLIAQVQHRWSEATSRFEGFRNRFPSLAEGYLGGAEVLRQQGMLAAAEVLLEQGMTEGLSSPQLFLEYARLAIASPVRERRNFSEAIRRAEQLRNRFPVFEPAYEHGIAILAEAERDEEAEFSLSAAMTRFPGSVSIAVQYARVAFRSQDYAEAAIRFEAVRQRFPDHSGGYIGLIQSLTSLERFDDADAVLKVAVDKFPANIDLLSQHATIATRRGEWVTALSRWEDVPTLLSARAPSCSSCV